MPPSLDMKTVVFIYLLINYLSTYQMALTWLRTRPRFPGVGILLAHFTLMSSGMSLGLLRASLPTFLTVLAANILMFCGIVSFAFGIGKFLNITVPKKTYALYCVAFAVLYAHFTYTDSDIRIRTIIFAGMFVPVCLHIFLICLRANTGKRHNSALNLSVAFALFGIFSALRVYYAFVGPDIPDFYNTRSPDSICIALMCVVVVFIIYSVQSMINCELLLEARKNAAEKDVLLQRMKRLATRDHLTDIWNRRHIEEILDQEIERHKRYGQPFCVILCDIDHFKAINDEHGHDAGDRAIIHVTNQLAANIRDVDGLGRWGGEEFLVVAPGMRKDQAMQAADRLRAMVAGKPVKSLDRRKRITLSCGVAEYVPGACADDLIKQADQALYRAKAEGRNRVEG